MLICFILAYTNFYFILPGETAVVEAIANLAGLKVCVAYQVKLASTSIEYRRWSVKNESTVEVISVNSDGDVTITGGKYFISIYNFTSF